MGVALVNQSLKIPNLDSLATTNRLYHRIELDGILSYLGQQLLYGVVVKEFLL